MKALKWFSILVFTLIVIISSITQVNSQCNTMKERFYIGAFNFLIRDHLHQPPIWNWYNELNYNAMHGYSGHTDSDVVGGLHDGGFFDPRNKYESYIDNIISDWHTSQPFNSLILEREKVLRGAYGQSSKYQAEERDINNVFCNSKAPGYGYDIHLTGRDSIDYWYNYNYTINPTYEYVKSRHCVPGDGSGYIVKQLFENCEQVNYTAYDTTYSNSSSRRLMSDIKYPGYRWFVKPRMRVDSMYAKNNVDTPVVSIITKNFGGVTIDSTVIYCRNFLKYFYPNYFYNGSYLERYYNMDKQDSALSVVATFLADPTQHDYKGYTLNIDSSKVDYQVYWHGIVDVWLDYVRVDDEWAHYLFTNQDGHIPPNIDIWQFYTRINDEVDAFANEQGFGYFYTDESGYSTIPCIAEVNRLVRALSGNRTGLLVAANEDMLLAKEIAGLRRPPSREDLLSYMYNTGAVKDILMYTVYPYYVDRPLPANITVPDKSVYPGTTRFHNAPSNDLFNDSMNMQFYSENNTWDMDFLGINYLRRASTFAKNHNLLYSQTMQVNADQLNLRDHPTGWGEREPLTEEISMQCYLGMAYGAKRILQYSYHTDGDFSYPGLGLENPDFSKRIKNYYSYFNNDSNRIVYLNKWYGVAALNHDLRIVGDYMYPPGDNANHMIYDNTKTVNYTGYSLPYRYLTNMNSYYSNNPSTNWDNTENLYQDASGKRYWEIGFFDKPNDNFSKYFLLVNKRCSPVLNGVGDKRTVRFYFDNNSLPDFYNWTLIDIKTGNRIVFNKNDANGVYFSFPFEPGEGKLFRLAPTMITGGDLTCDESFSGQVFQNDSTVNGNGHDITIGGNNTISFKGTIVMNGGTFKCGSKFSYQPVILQGATLWSGLELNNCTSITIQNATIKDIPYFPNAGSFYGVKIYGGSDIVIKNSTFNNNTYAGFVDANFINNDDSYSSIYLVNNNIIGDYCMIGFNINSNGGSQNQVYIQDNTFHPTSAGTAIFLNNVAGGVITGNSIYNCLVGINLVSSSVDIYGNNITSGSDYSNGSYVAGLNLFSQSTANLSTSKSESGTAYTGGSNHITNTGSSVNNIYTNNSVFYLDVGYNFFDINDNSVNHLSGWFPDSAFCENSTSVPATYNCFRYNGNESPKSDVSCGDGGNLVNFDFSYNICIPQNYDQSEVIALNENVADTLYYKSSGTGGSEKEYQNGQAMALQVTSDYKKLKDSIIINMRKRNFDLVSTKCTRLLTTYPDSSFAIDALSKLFYSNLKLDNNGNKIGPLKTFFETLILNNPNNFTLIKRTNYFVQKCKVILKQYTSALQGFQEIINQNPYSYEGLVASWDYAATTLLANSSGSFSNEEPGFTNNEEEGTGSLDFNITDLYSMHDTLKNRKVSVNTYTTSDYDQTKFTKQDRQTIKTNVDNMFAGERTKQITKLKELEKQSKSENLSISVKSKSELKTMKTLGEVVKVKKPHTVIEHINNVNNDIKKVLGYENEKNGNSQNNLIPTSYSLSQNYPNPFNPSTKINYELPKDGKVKLVIYDILGREIKNLVNNELKQAGRYTVEFNGTQFASGVYFYRIQIEGGKGFTAVKKMVLVK